MSAVHQRIIDGLTVTVCDAGLAELEAHRWRVVGPDRSHPYVGRYQNHRIVYLHRVLLGGPPKLRGDHINGDTLDNRLENLRLCTHAQNMKNRKRRRTAEQPYKGITRRGERYYATILSDGESFGLGGYGSAVEAAIAYDIAARHLHGEFASPNFSAARDWLLPYPVSALSGVEVLAGRGNTNRQGAHRRETRRLAEAA